jgi:hypothetical protein
MTCNEARELIGADPENASPELQAHLRDCAQCQAFRNEMLALNSRIRRALEIDWRKMQPAGQAPSTRTTPAVPSPRIRPDTSNVVPLARREPALVPRQKRPKILAFAASLAAALMVGFTLWLSRPPESLAMEIVEHVQGEPNSWSRTAPVPIEDLDAVLRKSGVRLGTGMQPVVYASACWFRGHFVPHFVVSTKDGPVTVLILAHETVPAVQQFSEGGYSGMLVPARKGSVAVLSRSPMPLEQPASDVVHALQSGT